MHKCSWAEGHIAIISHKLFLLFFQQILVENLQCAKQYAEGKKKYEVELSVALSLKGEHAYK